jgi:hypothetical protein
MRARGNRIQPPGVTQRIRSGQALPGGPSELTPTVTEVIFVRDPVIRSPRFSSIHSTMVKTTLSQYPPPAEDGGNGSAPEPYAPPAPEEKNAMYSGVDPAMSACRNGIISVKQRWQPLEDGRWGRVVGRGRRSLVG